MEQSDVGVWARLARLVPPDGGDGRDALARRGLRPWVPPREAGRVLIVRGVAPGLGVAVVGARAADAYGLAVAARVAEDAVALGMWVVSGGAEGCDAAAHRAAIRAGGRTVVVLGGGHDRPYPAVNRRLFDEVVEAGGAVVSGYWPSERPKKYRFLARNKVIAGLSRVVVVARAGARSGALTTAREGLAMGKPVFAVPGDVGQALSVGGHGLLARGALPLVCGQGLARGIGLEQGPAWPVGFEGGCDPWPTVRSDEGVGGVAVRAVLDALEGEAPLGLEGVLTRSGLGLDTVVGVLLELELGGSVRRLAGDRYIRSAVAEELSSAR
ncbi:MAG: DNA processing protein [Myxococcota bacterium]|jgi:DNA processing protein